MGTTLTGTTPQDTYDSLIKVTDNGPLSGSLKVLTDGLGNNSAISLSTAAASVTGTLAVTSGLTAATGSFLGSSANGTLRAEIAVEGVASTNTALIAKTSNGLNDVFRWFDGATQLGVFKNNGNVGIGTSAPAAKLDVNGGNIHSFYTYSGDGSNYNLRVGNDLDAAQFGYFSQLGASTFVANNNYYASAGQFKPTATAASSVSLAEGNIVFSCNTGLTVGTNYTPTERARFTPNGLCFNGDSAAANALDDYEEGTWTMGVSFGGASVGVAYTNNTGTYTKIGRQVTVNGYLLLSNKGSSTGGARITGLPFTIPLNNANYSAAALYFDSVTFTNQFMGIGVINNTDISLEEITVLGVSGALTNTDFANNSGVIVNFTYFV